MHLLYFHPPDEVPQQPTLRIEENEWRNPVSPAWFSLLSPWPWQFEQHESPTLETALVFDEWQNSVAPVHTYAVPPCYTADDVFVAPQPTIAVEEDWSIRPAPVAAYAVPRVFVDDETLVPVPPIQDEDFWTSAVAPIFTYPARVFLADDVIQIEPPARDEDYWQSGVSPVAASIYLLLPYLPDPEEIPASSLVVESAPDVLGVGGVAVVSGTGTVSEKVGVGQAGLASGSGGINQV